TDRARRRADNQRIVGKALAFGDDAAGTDKRIVSDLDAIEQDRAHADQRIVAYRAAVKNDVVANDTVTTDGQRKSGVGVQRRIVLNLRALTEHDPFVVAPQDRTEPDAGFGLEPHATDQHRSFRHIELAVAGKFGRLTVELVNGHSALPRGGANLPEPSFRG